MFHKMREYILFAQYSIFNHPAAWVLSSLAPSTGAQWSWGLAKGAALILCLANRFYDFHNVSMLL